jgi:ATPase family AAA domain-containing protein 3A/B
MAAAAATAAAAAISAGATAVLCSERAHAEGGTTFRFPGFSAPAPPPPSPPPAAAPQPSPAPPEELPRVSNQYARTTAPGFDPAPLERGLEALKELNKAQNPKKVRFLVGFDPFAFSGTSSDGSLWLCSCSS